jgi:hypothetical protein
MRTPISALLLITYLAVALTDVGDLFTVVTVDLVDSTFTNQTILPGSLRAGGSPGTDQPQIAVYTSQRVSGFKLPLTAVEDDAYVSPNDDGTLPSAPLQASPTAIAHSIAGHFWTEVAGHPPVPRQQVSVGFPAPRTTVLLI